MLASVDRELPRPCRAVALPPPVESNSPFVVPASGIFLSLPELFGALPGLELMPRCK